MLIKLVQLENGKYFFRILLISYFLFRVEECKHLNIKTLQKIFLNHSSRVNNCKLLFNKFSSELVFHWFFVDGCIIGSKLAVHMRSTVE